jgi:hypothetical protein
MLAVPLIFEDVARYKKPGIDHVTDYVVWRINAEIPIGERKARAVAAGLTPSTVSQVVNGAYGVSHRSGPAFAKMLGVRPEELSRIAYNWALARGQGSPAIVPPQHQAARLEAKRASGATDIEIDDALSTLSDAQLDGATEEEVRDLVLVQIRKARRLAAIEADRQAAEDEAKRTTKQAAIRETGEEKRARRKKNDDGPVEPAAPKSVKARAG